MSPPATVTLLDCQQQGRTSQDLTGSSADKVVSFGTANLTGRHPETRTWLR